MPRTGPYYDLQMNRAQMSPFARLIYDYMMSQTPNLSVKQLSDESGISNNAIWSWLKHGITPKRQKIVQFAERVRLPNGDPVFDLDELLIAAGLPTTSQLQRERAAHSDVLRASLDELLKLVDNDPTFGPDERALIHRAMEGKVEEFIQQTDTWREYGHASPAQYQAQRATDDALVYEPEPIRTPDEAHGTPTPPKRRQQHRDTNPSGPYPRQQ